MSETIVYEQPLNERCRTLLRLSRLFEQLDHHMPQEQTWHARAALEALLDISVILARADIKSELIKETERYHQALRRIADRPDVDGDRLNDVLERLDESRRALQHAQGQLGAALRASEFLNSVLQRTAIPGGGFDFDLPQLHCWLAQPHAERLLQLDAWRSEVAEVHEAVELLLGLIRHSTTFRPARAIQGFHAESLPSGAKAQLVRVRLPKDARLYAEISGGKHRFNIRFMDTSDWEHPVQVDRDVEFLLNVCRMPSTT